MALLQTWPSQKIEKKNHQKRRFFHVFFTAEKQNILHTSSYATLKDQNVGYKLLFRLLLPHK